ncbi:MAG: FG-GAP-like repeat-containing protein [Thermoplasmatota archaeon]
MLASLFLGTALTPGIEGGSTRVTGAGLASESAVFLAPGHNDSISLALPNSSLAIAARLDVLGWRHREEVREELSGPGLVGSAAVTNLSAGDVWLALRGRPFLPGELSLPCSLGPEEPFSTSAGDLNGDGAVDLAVAYKSSGRAGFFPGRAGALRSFVEAPGALSEPVSLAVGDLSGDGWSDLAVAESGGSRVTVFFQDPVTHALGSGITCPTSSPPAGVAIADVNSDGLLDIAAATGGPGGSFLETLRQNSTTHTLDHPVVQQLASPGTRPLDIAAGDLDGDSRADVAVSLSGGRVCWLAQGPGGLSNPISAPLDAGYSAGGLALGDVNGSWPGEELAVGCANATRSGLCLLRLTGGALMRVELATLEAEAPSSPPMAVGAGDLTGDGAEDVALGLPGRAHGRLVVLPRSPSGGLGAPVSHTVWSETRGLAISDFSGDGRGDVALACPRRGAVALFLQNSSGLLERAEDIDFAPSAVAVADLNGDGEEDIALGARLAGSIGVFYRSPLGGYGTMERVGPCDDPVSLAAGDLSGDGLPDLAVVCRGNDTLAVFTSGVGPSPPVWYHVGALPSDVRIGDLTGDGDGDAVVAHMGEGYLSVLAGGGGSLTYHDSYVAGAPQARLALGDFNSDGRSDVAASLPSLSLVTVFNQTADGRLSVPASYGVGAGPEALAAGDLNTDGRDDLVSCNAAGPSLTLLLQDGSGCLQRAGDPSLASRPLWASIGDVTPDDQPELWVVQESGVLGVLQQDNHGGLEGPLNYTLPGGSRALALADLNSDGALDIALASPQGELFPMTQLNLTEGEPRGYPAEAGSLLLASADINGDGMVDIASASATQLTVHVQGPGGGLVRVATRQWQAQGGSITGLAAGDLNGDGFGDVALTGLSTNYARVYYGGEEGLSESPLDIMFSSYCYGGLVIGDLTGDGRADLIRADSYYSRVGVAAQRSDGTLASPAYYSSGSSYTKGLAIGDLNHDGRSDLAADHYYTNVLGVLLQRADGTLESPATYPTSSHTLWSGDPVATGDVNGDGLDDVVLVCQPSRTLDVFTQAGDGTLNERVSCAVGGSDSYGPDVGVADIDLDGRAEVVVSNPSSANLTILHRRAGGSLEELASYETGASPHGLALADITQDGAPDIAVACQGPSEVEVFASVQRRGSLTLPPIAAPGGGGIESVCLSWTEASGPGSGVRAWVSGDGENWMQVESGATLVFRTPLKTLHRKFEFWSHSSMGLVGVRGLVCTYVCSELPTDPSLDIGADGRVEWSRAGPFTGKETLSGEVVVRALNEYLDGHRSLPSPVRIPLRLRSSTGGVLEVANILVDYDEPPRLARPIPAELCIDEDTANNELLDLFDLFKDDYDAELRFELLELTNGSIVNVSIVENDWVSVDAASWNSSRNWSGEVSFRLRATDGRGLSTTTETIRVEVRPVNDPPEIASAPMTEAEVGLPYEYRVLARDVDGDGLLFVLERAPAGMRIDPFTGLLTWTPGPEDAGPGEQRVSILVTDGELRSAPQEFTINVTPNLPPIVSSQPPLSILLGEEYVYVVSASDPEGRPLRLSLLKSPEGMVIDHLRSRVSWRPAAEHLGSHDVQLLVSDGYNSVIQGFRVGVLAKEVPNHPPVIVNTPSSTSALVGMTWRHRVLARDDDGDRIVFSLGPGPRGMVVDELSGLIEWTPDRLQTGNHTVVVHVSDGESSTAQLLTIRVFSVNGSYQPAPGEDGGGPASALVWGLWLLVLVAAGGAGLLAARVRRRPGAGMGGDGGAGGVAARSSVEEGAEEKIDWIEGPEAEGDLEGSDEGPAPGPGWERTAEEEDETALEGTRAEFGAGRAAPEVATPIEEEPPSAALRALLAAAGAPARPEPRAATPAPRVPRGAPASQPPGAGERAAAMRRWTAGGMLVSGGSDARV